MTHFGKVFEEFLPEYQAHVEDVLDVKLGNISIRPIWEAAFRDHELVIDDERRVEFLRLMLTDPVLIAKAGDESIYHLLPRHTTQFLPERAKYVLLHELYHIAQARMAGRQDGTTFAWERGQNNDIPPWMDEGVAEYLAILSAQALGTPKANPSRLYDRYVAYLCEKLDEKGITEPKEIMHFSINYREPIVFRMSQFAKMHKMLK
jgi:hypothetical protein